MSVGMGTVDIIALYLAWKTMEIFNSLQRNLIIKLQICNIIYLGKAKYIPFVRDCKIAQKNFLRNALIQERSQNCGGC